MWAAPMPPWKRSDCALRDAAQRKIFVSLLNIASLRNWEASSVRGDGFVCAMPCWKGFPVFVRPCSKPARRASLPMPVTISRVIEK